MNLSYRHGTAFLQDTSSTFSATITLLWTGNMSCNFFLLSLLHYTPFIGRIVYNFIPTDSQLTFGLPLLLRIPLFTRFYHTHATEFLLPLIFLVSPTFLRFHLFFLRIRSAHLLLNFSFALLVRALSVHIDKHLELMHLQAFWSSPLYKPEFEYSLCILLMCTQKKSILWSQLFTHSLPH